MIKINEDVIKIMDDFKIFAKDKGFKRSIHQKKNDATDEVIYFEWIKLTKEDVCVVINETYIYIYSIFFSISVVVQITMKTR